VIDAFVQGSKRPLHLTITGIYKVPDLKLPYWWGNETGFFPFGHTSGPPSPIPEIDSLITSSSTALAVPALEAPDVIGQLPLDAAQVNLSDEGEIRDVTRAVAATVSANGLRLSTQLPALLASADHQRHVMATIVVVAAVELVVLALWVLGSMLVRTADARRSEIRVARLRGFPATTMLWATAAEPAILCLLGLVVGLAAAWITVIVARNRLLDHAATVSPDMWVLAALGASIVAIIAALGLGTVRLLRGSTLGESSGAARPAVTRLSLVGDVVLLVLSGVALVALGTSGALSGRSNPIASAAPGLIALGAAVLAVQLVLFACRLGVSASAFSRRVAPFLALRQVVRRPAVLRQARVLIIALGLACFATAAWAVARSNRAHVATFNIGTSTVVSVTPQTAGLEQAVDRVDPRGRFAMAATTVLTTSSELLAVDARRLPDVTFWPPTISRSSIGAISRALRPRTEPEVMIPDAPLQVKAATSATGIAPGSLGELELDAWVFNPQTGTTIIGLGTLRPGGRSYRGSLGIACPGGCRLVGVGVLPLPNRPAPSAGTIHLRLTDFLTQSPSGRWTSLGADLGPRGWRSTVGGVQVRSAAPGSLVVVIPATAAVTAAGASAPPMAVVADVPDTLPAAVTAEAESLNGASPSHGTVPAQGLDGSTLEVRPVATVSALPRLGGDAVMVDLGLLGRLQSAPTIISASDQVWLGPAAPANAIARLQAAGLRVDDVQRASALLKQSQRSGAALADDFLLVATIAALLVAAASTLGSSARRSASGPLSWRRLRSPACPGGRWPARWPWRQACLRRRR
jgi:hypothetical protein